MAKKKLLNEAQVRRFMGLAGIQPLAEKYNKRDDDVKEMKYKRDDEKMEEELDEAMYAEEDMDEGMEEDMDEGMYAEQEPAADDEMDAGAADDTKEISQDMVDDAAEALDSLQGLISALGGAAGGGEMDMEPEADADADLGAAMDMGDEDEEAEEDAEEVIAEALSGVNLQLSENEVVQEVARRVAKRILKAKQAQAQLDEALGSKKTRARRSRRTQRK